MKQINFIAHDRFPDLSSYIENNRVTSHGITRFQHIIRAFYDEHGRVFPWRNIQDPYYIVVSEIMLQQTQTERVKEKFEHFIERFPSCAHLAAAPISQVIMAWQGLGYNRRALALHQFAQRVQQEYNGLIPDIPELLVTFKGIGKATAASICAFAFNKPTVFVETNIRSVFIHTFFQHALEPVSDAMLFPLIEDTLYYPNARAWYYGLMDYGVALKKALGNPNKKSAHYAKQSVFEGSERQIRGHIVRLLSQHEALMMEHLIDLIKREPIRIEHNLQMLHREGFIEKRGAFFILKK